MMLTLKQPPLDPVHREAHPIDADRPLRRDESHQLRGSSNCRRRERASSLTIDQPADRIHVAAHQMPAQRIAGAQARLEVHARTGFERAQGGLRRGSRARRRRKTRSLDPGRRQAHALDAHAVSNRDPRHVEAAGIDAELEVAPALQVAPALGDRDQPSARDDDSVNIGLDRTSG